MNFSKINFYFDHEGNHRGIVKPDGFWQDKPVVLHAAHCNATMFNIWSGHRNVQQWGSVKIVSITRGLGPLAKDPYNCDGKPPTHMFEILAAQITSEGSVITIEGFEQPNLCWAGMLTPPYTHEYKWLRNPTYMEQEMKEKIHHLSYPQLKRQRIELR